MSDFGLLVTAGQRTPATVQIDLDGDDLLLIRPGDTRSVALKKLWKVADSPIQLVIGRRGERGWRLTVSGAVADQLRCQLAGRRRLLRWGAGRTWHAAIFIVTLLAVELVKVPAQWLAPLVPASIERRMVDSDLRTYYGSYCRSPAGERVVRGLITRFDPAIAKSVRIEVLTGIGFIITAVPGNRLVISNAFLTTTDGDEFAALLAHEVAHLQTGDAARAWLRANGTLGALVGAISGARKPAYEFEFSPNEEWSADQRAIQMLSSARISPLPGAALYARIQHEREANRSFGKEQYYLHYGLGDHRAALWRDSEDKGQLSLARPALTGDEADSLFNYCHLTKGPPRHPLPKPGPYEDGKGA